MRIRRTSGRRLRERIEQDIDAGIPPGDTDAGTLADLVMMVIPGPSTPALDGASRQRLIGVIETAMRAWLVESADA